MPSTMFLVFAILLVVSSIRETEALPMLRSGKKVAKWFAPAMAVVMGTNEFLALKNGQPSPIFSTANAIQKNIPKFKGNNPSDESNLKKEREISNLKTDLNHAIRVGDVNVVRDLIEKNAAIVNMVADDGFYPLHLAALKGHENVVHLLIANGALVNAVGINGETPLHLAAENDNANIVRFLITQNAKKNAQDKYGETPLHRAIACRRLNIIKLLINEGVNVNVKDNLGLTPLHAAALRGCPDTVSLLISNGADANEKDNNGLIPFNYVGNSDYPYSKKELETIEILNQAPKKKS